MRTIRTVTKGDSGDFNELDAAECHAGTRPGAGGAARFARRSPLLRGPGPKIGCSRWTRFTSKHDASADLRMREASTVYFEAALVIGMLGFVSSAALAKFLLRGEVIE